MTAQARESRPRGFLERYARILTRLRYAIVVFWVAAAALSTIYLPSVEDAQVGALGDLVPNNAKAIEAEERSSELFGFPLLSRTVVVQRDPDGLSAAAQARVLSRAVAINRAELEGLEDIAGAIPLTNVLGQPPFSRERSTTALTFLFFRPDIGPSARARLTERLHDEHVSRPGDAYVGSTGAISARQEQASLIKEALPVVELATIVLVLVAVALHFRAALAPLINLATVATAYLVAVRLIATIGEAIGVSVPRDVEPVIVVLLFGVITDYSIFFLSRFRRLLAEGLDTRSAVERSTTELTPIVFTAGMSIVVASAALLVARLGFLQAFGPGLALAVLIGVAVALTLLPALLAIIGPRTFWPRRPAAGSETEPDDEAGRTRPRSWALRVAGRRPAAVVAVSILVLLVMASGLHDLKVGHPLVRGLPDGNPVKTAYTSATGGFTPGVLAPTVVFVEAPGVVRRDRALTHFQRLLERQPGVAEVAGPGSTPFRVNVGATRSPTGDATRFVLVFDADPLGAGAIRTLQRLQRRVPALLDRAGLGSAKATYAGDTALVAETVDETYSDLGRVAPVTVLGVLLVLAIFLRALVAPLYLVLTSVLAVAASLGLTVYVFVGLLGQPELAYFAPFTAAVLLVALGSDYNVFVVGRIWLEARGRPVREAVAVGGGRAARPITAAGVILALSFALLAIVPLQAFREIAFAMAAGLLIEAFLVRTMLVPALITLVGERGGWPGRGLSARRA